MPTKRSKSPSTPLREALKECTTSQITDVHSSLISNTSVEDCSCECKNHQNSDEWEVDNEELLHVEINGIFQDILPSYENNSASINNSNEIVQFLGLDSSEPIAQIGGTVEGAEGASSTFFSGHYENTVGTSTFFALENSNSEEIGAKGDQVFFEESEPSLAKKIRYVCKADKKLVLKRVFLNKKTNPDTEEVREEDLETIKRQVLHRPVPKSSSAGPSAAPSDL